tara:strand:- start:16131 stop:16937 length:807 start_codon:yes stop_codon:yes gene_type:complete
MMLLCSVYVGYAKSGQDLKGNSGQIITDRMISERVEMDSVQINLPLNSWDIQMQETSESRFRELYEQLETDFSLGISYNNRSLNRSFLENNSILSKKGFEDQFLYSIDISPAVILLDQFVLEFTYSSIPEQRNFPSSTVLNFESERVILNEVNRYSGHALAFSTAYTVPIIEGVRAAVHAGISSLKLNVEETMQYHPDDPFARDYTIVTLPFRKRVVTYSNPFAGLSAEFQLRSVRVSTGYQIQLYQLEEVSSTNFYISLGVRFRDLF